jgi:hypothetical protein
MKDKKLELTIKERAILPDLLPQQGNRLQQIVIRTILSKIEFSSNEISNNAMTFSPTGIGWSKDAANKVFDFSFEASEISILKESAILADKENRVTQHNLSLIEKIERLS